MGSESFDPPAFLLWSSCLRPSTSLWQGANALLQARFHLSLTMLTV